MSATWTTKDGQQLDPQWMTSPHLVHSVSMLVRQRKQAHMGATNIMILRAMDNHFMVKELKSRRLFNLDSNGIVIVPAHRENNRELCLLRALIEVDAVDPWFERFYGSPGVLLAWLTALPMRSQIEEKIWFAYCVHRLRRS